jgi:hypothetical protein
VTAGLGLLYLFAMVHPALDWLGGPVVWRLASTAVLGGLGAAFWLLRGRIDPDGRPLRWAMFVAGLAAFFAFTLGGFVRERAKSPQTVYKEIEKPEATAFERDRFLVYETCVRCHHRSPKDFRRYAKKDWAARVARERERPGVEITDDEARRIVEFLEEQYR